MTDDMDALYTTIGSQLKHVFTGFNAWIIGFRDEHFKKIGLAASSKTPMLNGSLECELREYIIFDGEKKAFRREGGSLKSQGREATPKDRRMRRKSDQEWKADARKKGFGGKESRPTSRKPFESRNQDRPKSYTRREFNPAAVNSENPLAARRNEQWLEEILNRAANGEKKTAPATKRGWKRNNPKNNKPDNND
jgi:putative N6-adenine-specific DNA methylase